MHKMFLLFMTVAGQPTGETMHILPLTPDCHNEMLFVRAINAVYAEDKSDIVLYGSCEPVRK